MGSQKNAADIGGHRNAAAIAIVAAEKAHVVSSVSSCSRRCRYAGPDRLDLEEQGISAKAALRRIKTSQPGRPKKTTRGRKDNGGSSSGIDTDAGSGVGRVGSGRAQLAELTHRAVAGRWTQH